MKQLLLKRGRFWSGIEFLPLNSKWAKIFHLPQTSGVLIQRVANGSLAQSAGLEGGRIQAVIEGKPLLLGGDIILSINGNSFDNQQSVDNIMQSIKDIKPGKVMEIVVWRYGKKQNISFHIPG